MARPKRGEEKNADKTVTMRMPSALKDAMTGLAKAQRRTFTAQMTIAIEEHLAAHQIDWKASPPAKKKT